MKMTINDSERQSKQNEMLIWVYVVQCRAGKEKNVLPAMTNMDVKEEMTKLYSLMQVCKLVLTILNENKRISEY